MSMRLKMWPLEWMNGVLRPVDNCGHIGHTYILTNAKWKYIHVEQHKTNMINEEWNKTQDDAPSVAFYDMRAVTFVLPDAMANVSIAGLQWFIFIPRLNHTGSHRPIDSHSIPYLHREKNIGFGTRTTQPTNYEESSRSSLILVASYDMP